MDANYKISRSSLHVEVTDRLREMIYERSLPPGERIDELGLSARLGTSRTPLREALKVLAHEGLVRLVPGRGAFVIELSANEAESLFPVLGLLQSRCAAEAVRRQTPEDIAALDTLLASLESAVTGNRLTDYYRAVDGFHERLQAMAANPWLTRSITDLGRFLQMVRTLMPLPENRLRQSMAEYRTLMKAIHRGDADAAEQIVYLQAMAQQRAWRMLQQQAQETAAAQEAAAQGADTTAPVTSSATATNAAATTEAPSPSQQAATAHASPQGNASAPAYQEASTHSGMYATGTRPARPAVQQTRDEVASLDA
ncbi:GntR family transcriptional regulator [Lautropia mirabilis]|uniref:GntR family transcriptional regulator n=1 Tax=Lautropia mirabilis TaxID=47671 RepID=UPI001CB3E221|nr:GntR family transcriptional regulator [Lautropia mirabilis]MBF1238313.1 GntR family transcriptional regulator [Lautropia mirabilis]